MKDLYRTRQVHVKLPASLVEQLLEKAKARSRCELRHVPLTEEIVRTLAAAFPEHRPVDNDTN